MIMPKKWEAIASDPAHFGGNRREAVERCYALHCEPPRELTDAEIEAIHFNFYPLDSRPIAPFVIYSYRAVIAAHEAKQREPETVTFRAARDAKDGEVQMFHPSDDFSGTTWEWLEPAQTIEVKLP